LTEAELAPEVRSALFELQRYLSDQLAPLMVVDSIEVLMEQPPKLVASEIHAWTTSQFRGQGAEIPISDYLFHAVKKLVHFSSLRLIPKSKMASYLLKLREPVLEICPPEDRAFLAKNLDVLGDSESGFEEAGSVYRQPGTESKLAIARQSQGGGLAPGTERLAHRMGLAIERLQRLAPSGAPATAAAAAQHGSVVSEAVTSAASLSRSSQELDQHLDRIRDAAGVDVNPTQLFRFLGNSLPEWAVPLGKASEGEGEGEFPPTEDTPIEAIRRIVTLAGNPQETARRFRELVAAAIEQFNQGSIGRAVTMIELAGRLMEDRLVDDAAAASIRRSAQEELDHERLRAGVEKRECHYLLRKILNFFPGLTPQGLLDDLKGEDRRERRRFMLALLEVHAEEARRAALERLSEGDVEKLASSDIYFVRNLLYLLNRIPFQGRASDEELQIAGALSAPRYRPVMAREAIAHLGQSRHDGTEAILIQRLGEYESLLQGKEPFRYPVAEIRQILDRIVGALVRIGTARALEAVADHGLKEGDERGHTKVRLAQLGSHDLSDHPDLVARLTATVRDALPRKVLGFVMKRQNVDQVEPLLDALAGTQTPEVLTLMEEIRQKYPDQPFAKKAESILTSSGVKSHAPSPSAGAPSLSGDLELFGLPNLMQSLSGAELTGLLTVTDREGGVVGAVTFDHGRIARCHVGHLRGRDAVFQLFEQAVPGTFTFAEHTELIRDESEPPPIDVVPLTLEALRRFDELRTARALVPPDVPLRPTGIKPVHHPRENDPKVIREVWMKASTGAAPAEWEHQVPVDSYRIWRLLAYWVETGALDPA
jgi:hypothetical protein